MAEFGDWVCSCGAKFMKQEQRTEHVKSCPFILPKPSTRDELAEAFVKNYVTINNRPPHRPDVMKHCYSTGYSAGRASAGEMVNKLTEIAFYLETTSPSKARQIREAIEKWERGE